MLSLARKNVSSVQERFQSVKPPDPAKFRLGYRIIVAIIAVVFMYAATNVLTFYPSSWRSLIILIVAGLWVLSPRGGQAFTLLALMLPLMYNIPLLANAGPGVIWLLGLGLISTMIVFNPYAFIIFMISMSAFFSSGLGGFLLIAPIALAFLTPAQGATISGFTCFFSEMMMLIGGRASVGLLAGGIAAKPLVVLHKSPVSSLVNFGWIHDPKNFNAIGAAFGQIFSPFIERPILIGQIFLWVVATITTSVVLEHPFTKRLPVVVQAILTGVILLWIGQVVFTSLLANGASLLNIGLSLLLPTTVLLCASPLLERLPSAIDPTLTFKRNKPKSATSLDAPEVAAKTDMPSTRREIPTDTWEDLAGIDSIRQELIRAVQSQFDEKVRESQSRIGLTPTRGILLFGPPGTGKTKLARVVAHEANAAFFAVSGTEFTSKFFGESEARLRQIFDEARQNRPAVLFFDELEAFLPKRSEMGRSDAPEKGIIATFLAYTDGTAEMEGVLLIGATNYPNLIDPAALRPGRFDKLIYVSPPDKAMRALIFTRYLKDISLAPDVDLDKIAGRCERFTGADIQRVCSEVLQKALERGGGQKPDAVTMSDLENAVSAIKATVTIPMLREYEALADQYGRRSERPDHLDVISKPDLHWEDVAGLDDVKTALREAIEMPLAHPELFAEYGVQPSKGVLMFGPPGCGKTFLAKVVASESKAHFLTVNGPSLLDRYVGGSEAALRDIFIRARENTPCVLFFDEIDAITGARGSIEANSTKILTQFLTEMDGVDELKGVIVVGATNRPDTLDTALLRPGRFDRIVYVPPPDSPARVALIQQTLGKRPLEEGVNFEQIAEATQGYSAADITGICNAAAMQAAREALRSGERQLITTASVLEEVRRTPRSISDSDIELYESLRDRMQR